MRPKVSEARSVLLNWGSFALTALAGLFLAPRVLKSLGNDAYGVWILVGSLVGPLGLLDLGVRNAVTRLVARAFALDDHATSSTVASTARLIFWFAGALAVLVAAVLAMGLTHWFKVPPELATSGRIVALLVGSALALSLSTGLHSGVLTAVRRLDLLGVAGIALELARLASLLFVVWISGGLLGVAIATLGLAVARYLWLRAEARRVYPELRYVISAPDRQVVKAILDIGIYATVIYSLSTATAQVNTYVIGAMLPLTMVTYHAVGATLPSYIHAMSLPIAQSVLPQASQLEATGDHAGIRALILESGRFGALAVLPMILAFMTRGPTFLGIWMGPEFRSASGPVLIILSFAAATELGRHVMQTVFVGTGRHRQLMVWYAAEAFLTVVLSVVFVRKWGILGAAWATVIPNLLINWIVFPLLISRNYAVSTRDLWVDLWIRPIIALSPFAILSWLTDRQWPAHGYTAFFGQVILLLPIAILGAATVGMSSAERRRVSDAVRAKVATTVAAFKL